MALGPLSLAKVLYFSEAETEYVAALSNEWSDYDLLVKSIRMGCKRSVEKLVELGCRVNRPGRYGSPLSMTVRNGWWNVAAKMLDRGARISDLGWNVDSPLRCAFFDEKEDAITRLSVINAMLDKHLMEKKTDFVHADGLSFFHIACARGELKYVKEFLRDDRVCNVDGQVASSAERYAGYSALHFAVEFERRDVLEFLLKRGADTYVQDAGGSTPLHLSFYREDWQAVDRLLTADRQKKDVTNDFGLTHFMIACSVGDSLHAEQYLWKIRRSHGASGPSILICRQVKAPTMRCIPPYASCTPLHFAAMFGRLDTVQVLLSHHANCCATNGDWHTPAELARRNRHRLVRRVLERHCARATLDDTVHTNLTSVARSTDDSAYDSLSSSNASP